MQVHFSEIPLEGLRLEIWDESWFPDQELTRNKAVTALVLLTKKGERVLLDGKIDTEVVLDCDRCLEAYPLKLDFDFRIEFELLEGGSNADIVSDHLCSTSEMDMVYVSEPVIDLFQVLRQQVFLMLPLKKICSETCKGLCKICGRNLNKEQCQCARQPSDSPFSVLEKLKK